MKWIKPSRISGTLSAPASKSLMIRASAAALLAEGDSQIANPSFCQDAQAGLQIIQALGAKVNRKGELIRIRGSRILQKRNLDCYESGLCMRLFTPISTLYDQTITLSGRGSLRNRPMVMMEEPLRQLGASCKTKNGLPPIEVRGPIRGGSIEIDGSLSSQFLTGLLMTLPLCPNDSEIQVKNLKSKPYVAMTLSLLRDFGILIDSAGDFERFSVKGNQSYQSRDYVVEGDWSAASFLLVAGAIGGKITIKNLIQHSLQADKKILEALRMSGARISIAEDTVSVEESSLKAFAFDATDFPDLFPPLVALACYCRGRSFLNGVERLLHKETNRASALLTEFSKIGAKISIKGNKMEIEGTRLQGGIINSHQDHRIAMAGAIAGLCSKNGTQIRGWRCVSKSYPGFFEGLKSLGGEIL